MSHVEEEEMQMPSRLMRAMSFGSTLRKMINANIYSNQEAFESFRSEVFQGIYKYCEVYRINEDNKRGIAKRFEDAINAFTHWKKDSKSALDYLERHFNSLLEFFRLKTKIPDVEDCNWDEDFITLCKDLVFAITHALEFFKKYEPETRKRKRTASRNKESRPPKTVEVNFVPKPGRGNVSKKPKTSSIYQTPGAIAIDERFDASE